MKYVMYFLLMYVSKALQVRWETKYKGNNSKNLFGTIYIDHLYINIDENDTKKFYSNSIFTFCFTLISSR